MSLLGHLKDRIQGKAPKGARRSSRWPGVRAKHLEDFPACRVCGSKKKVQVHHIRPFHLHPELELEPSNLITLCESWLGGVNCHLFVGHLGSFQRINPEVLGDASSLSGKLSRAKENG